MNHDAFNTFQTLMLCEQKFVKNQTQPLLPKNAMALINIFSLGMIPILQTFKKIAKIRDFSEIIGEEIALYHPDQAQAILEKYKTYQLIANTCDEMLQGKIVKDHQTNCRDLYDKLNQLDRKYSHTSLIVLLMVTNRITELETLINLNIVKVKEVDQAGRTHLHNLTSNKHGFTLRKSVRFFVDAGTDPTVKDNTNKTARDYENEKTEPREKVVLFLKEAEEEWVAAHPDNSSSSSSLVMQ